jgi:hypothetical protein
VIKTHSFKDSIKMRSIIYARTCIVSFILFTAMPSPQTWADEVDSGDARTTTNFGDSYIISFVKKRGLECATGLTKKCSPGKACFSNIAIGGETAKKLYDLLKSHGVKSSDSFGDYVATNSEAMTCSKSDDSYSCGFGYDAINNSITASSDCDGD